MHLKPLRQHLEEIEQTEVSDLPQVLAPMLHVMGLLWGNSKYYCDPGRIVVLSQEIGNLLIELVCICFITLHSVPFIVLYYELKSFFNLVFPITVL